MEGGLYLVDDHPERWIPFSLTRPLGELYFGRELLRERAARVLGLGCRGHVNAALAGFDEDGAAPAVSADGISSVGPRIFLLSRFALTRGPGVMPDGPASLCCQGTPVGLFLPSGYATPALPEAIEQADYSSVEVQGHLLDSPWDLMSRNSERLIADGESLAGGEGPTGRADVIGNGPVWSAPGVTIEPGVVIDTSNGPVMLDAGVHIRAFTRLAGPAYVGPGTTILGGSLGNVTIGPRCKIRGEVESTVIHGFTNKAHDGFIGHAILGRWVNLGAMTTNSDLKNNYGPVRLQLRGETVDTGLMKVGCLLGDHVRTGIGTTLNTGAVVEFGSNLFGGAMPPKYVPPFSWGVGGSLVEYRFDRFLETATTAMSRRDIPLSEDMRALYERAFVTTAGLRTTTS